MSVLPQCAPRAPCLVARMPLPKVLFDALLIVAESGVKGQVDILDGLIEDSTHSAPKTGVHRSRGEPHIRAHLSPLSQPIPSTQQSHDGYH